MKAQTSSLNDWTSRNPSLRLLMPFQPQHTGLITELQRGDARILVYQDDSGEEFLVTYSMTSGTEKDAPAEESYYYCSSYAEAMEFLNSEFGDPDKSLNFLAMSA